MDKIASPQEFTAELRSLIKLVQSPNPSRLKLAQELQILAERVGTSRFAMEFDTPEAMKSYFKEHPAADRSKHTVKKPESKKSPEADNKALSKVRDSVTSGFDFIIGGKVRREADTQKSELSSDGKRYTLGYNASTGELSFERFKRGVLETAETWEEHVDHVSFQENDKGWVEATVHFKQPMPKFASSRRI